MRTRPRRAARRRRRAAGARRTSSPRRVGVVMRHAPVDATGSVGALGLKKTPLEKGVPVGGESPTASNSRGDRISDTFLGAIGFDGEKKLSSARNGADPFKRATSDCERQRVLRSRPRGLIGCPSARGASVHARA